MANDEEQTLLDLDWEDKIASMAIWVRVNGSNLAGNVVSRRELMDHFKIKSIYIDEIEHKMRQYGVFKHVDLEGTENQSTTYRYEG